MNLPYTIKIYKSLCHIQDHTKFFRYNGLCLEVAGYVLAVLLHHLLKSNRKNCYLLEIIFANCFLTVFNKIKEHVWHFLNHLSFYKEIHY